MRERYAGAVAAALKPGGHLLAVFYMNPDHDEDGPPFGVAPAELDTLFGVDFELLDEWQPGAPTPGAKDASGCGCCGRSVPYDQPRHGTRLRLATPARPAPRTRLTVRIKPADVEELMPRHLTVGETTLFNAKRKARAVARTEENSLVLAADTLVALGGRILGKPQDLDEAFEMLSLLSGNTHEVFSGVWLVCTSAKKICGFIEVSRVTFRKLAPAEIREYMRRISPLDKAGAYAAQQNEMDVIASIQGSRTNVVGLPMEKLAAALRAFDTISLK